MLVHGAGDDDDGEDGGSDVDGAHGGSDVDGAPLDDETLFADCFAKTDPKPGADDVSDLEPLELAVKRRNELQEGHHKIREETSFFHVRS